jgi:hypothetical protein
MAGRGRGVLLLAQTTLESIDATDQDVKYSDAEIQFGQEVAQLKVAAAQSTQPVAVDAAIKPIWEDLVRLAAVRPRTAIVLAWDKVEETLIRVAKDRVEAAKGVWQTPMVLGAVMLNKGEISTDPRDTVSFYCSGS